MADINSKSKMLQEMFYIAGQEKKSQWWQKKMPNTMWGHITSCYVCFKITDV